jgi:hypothetical protein
MRRLTPLLVLVSLAACGGGDPTDLPGTATPLPPNVPVVSGTVAQDGPPKILLTSEAGIQVATPGGYCGPSNGAMICVDTTEPHPTEVSVVRPGGAVSIRLVGYRVLSGSEVAVKPYGCGQDALQTFRLDPGREATTWEVSLEPGEYELHVFARFAYGEALRGDVGGALGLRVDDSAAIAVKPGPPRRC